MEENQVLHPFVKSENIYFRVTLFMVLASILLTILGYGMVKAMIPMPEPITVAVMGYMFAHAIHFGYGVYRLFYFYFKVRKQALGIKITKTIISVILSPINAVITYVALFLLILSSCAAG